MPLKVQVITSGGSTPITIQTNSTAVLTTTGSDWIVVTIGGTAIEINLAMHADHDNYVQYIH